MLNVNTNYKLSLRQIYIKQKKHRYTSNLVQNDEKQKKNKTKK